MTKRVLVVAYAYPPVGGAGVQRVTKFTKYLPRYGWQASVLTVSNPSVPLHDPTLCADIPPQTIVRRARTWEPSYGLKTLVSGQSSTAQKLPGFARRIGKGIIRGLSTWMLQPDPQVLWVPEAIRQGAHLLRELPHDAIMVTAPPFSAFFIGAALSRRTGLPLLLDYRDEWTLSSAFWENRRFGKLSSHLQNSMQSRVVRAAKALLATTRASAQALERIRVQAGSSARVAFIYNGYDSEDFERFEASLKGNNGVFRLAYTGTLWNLASIAPLVAAVDRLLKVQPALKDRLQITIAGRRTGPQQKLVDQLKSFSCQVIERAYLEHHESIGLLQNSDALCLLLSDLPGAERVVPAKVFEYMAARKPILSIAPQGEVWEILKDYPAGSLFEPSNIEGISKWLGEEVQRPQNGIQNSMNGWSPARYSRECQTGQLVELLESIT